MFDATFHAVSQLHDMFVVLLGVQRPFYAADVLATLLDVLRNLPRARLRRAFTEDFGEALE